MYKIIANKEQLESIGISYDINELTGSLEKEYSNGWLTLCVKHKIGYIEVINIKL